MSKLDEAMLEPVNPSLDGKVAFLSRPESYPHRPATVEAKETHMSWVFLAGDHVYKLKKPVSYPFLDFSTLAARQRNCREEVRLNARLAEDVYLGVMPLRATAAGGMSLETGGEVVDWLVHMRRLPADRMLDILIAGAHVNRTGIEHAADKLAQFYASSPAQEVTASWVMARFAAEHDQDARLLTDRRFAVDGARTAEAIGAMRSALHAVAPLIEARAAAKVYVEGHGDLRPEHVCLLEKPVFIDCLEFNRDLRILDPFDEIAYLGVECDRLGAAWIGEVFLSAAHHRLAVPAPRSLILFYRAARALLRARLALAHLIEPNPRTSEKWEPRARQYIGLAADAVTAFAASPAGEW